MAAGIRGLQSWEKRDAKMTTNPSQYEGILHSMKLASIGLTIVAFLFFVKYLSNIEKSNLRDALIVSGMAFLSWIMVFTFKLLRNFLSRINL